ncbi:glycerophosphodiester phosphodiesterase family protein [Sphingomicrobium marinum]|uniref:glycerophosphodiester phosphodiesterase family protein n=1 Tax=Sphingomicrobium marinum TaxID=1227950 RepID=UPI00223FF707|nr:glycerophosphodiester phosphodiesterase family protein [Sphingomicrobium marinum]
MKTKILAAAAALALTACNAAENTAPAAESGSLAEPSLPLSMPEGGMGPFLACLQDSNTAILSAHRGGAGPGYPENAIETLAWNASVAPMMFEIDVRQTSDGEYVLFHDEELQQDTDGSGFLAYHTLEDLKDVRYNGTDIGISTLEEVVEWARGKALLQLDVKRGIAFDPLIDWLEERDATGFTLIITYNVDDAATVERANDEIMISASVDNLGDLATLNAAGVPDERITAWTGLSTPRIDLWRRLGERGIGANYGAFATLDEQNASGEAYRALVEAGLDVVSTDKPQFVYDALEERQDFAAAATACMAQ